MASRRRTIRKEHFRKTRRGKTRVKTHRMKCKKKSKKAILSSRERAIFNSLTKDKKGTEYAGQMDFEKKGDKILLENFDASVGENGTIDFPISHDKDVEVSWHTHPPSDILIFSGEDMESIINETQQAEILFHKGNALVLGKPEKLNKKKFLKEYKRELNNLRKKDASKKEYINNLSKILRKHGFKLKKFTNGKKLKIPLREVY